MSDHVRHETLLGRPTRQNRRRRQGRHVEIRGRSPVRRQSLLRQTLLKAGRPGRVPRAPQGRRQTPEDQRRHREPARRRRERAFSRRRLGADRLPAGRERGEALGVHRGQAPSQARLLPKKTEFGHERAGRVPKSSLEGGGLGRASGRALRVRGRVRDQHRALATLRVVEGGESACAPRPQETGART